VKLTQNGETVTEEYFRGVMMNVCGIVDYYKGSPQIKLLTLADAEITAQ
jgi:DNA/RNA endonuclease YhcR with UshA esterase domain